MKEKTIRIKFKREKSNFFKELNDEVQEFLNQEIILESERLMYRKLVFYIILFVGLYGMLFSAFSASNYIFLIVNYILFGLSGILLAFNSSHDAVHQTLFKDRKKNDIFHYIVFNLQGVNATLWKQRHMMSHHVFPNVDGCDADIDDNPFVRLSHTQKWRPFHQYQHLYAPFLYCAYTLHWIILKDFMYLAKDRVANMTNLSYTKRFKAEVVLLKLLYLGYTIILPYMMTPYSLMEIIGAFIIMHVVISIFFVLTLIISHLTMETVFPQVDEKGILPFDFHEHQLSVSMDYHPRSRLANWIFGGFNAHSAHHLFPNLKHTVYPLITPFIQAKAQQFRLPYNELSIINAIRSHFRYLRKVGRPSPDSYAKNMDITKY